MRMRKANQLPEDGITALYVRVSTDAQYEEGYSLEAQEQKLKQWCELKDYKNYQVYPDGGWSGSNLDRPEMKRLMFDITNHRVRRVIVYKLDRLSRSQKDTLFLLEELFIPNDIEFISINENFDTSTPYGKAMIGILSVFAQLERENIRERTRMGMYERVKAGYWMGGNGTPFGYDYDSSQDILVPNEHAEDVRKIYELYLQGYSTTMLAKMFPVSGDRQITLILDRITYIGKISYNGEIFQGRHEPIIDENTWNQVQEERERRSTKSTTSSNYLLTGLVYCGKCGAKMRYQKWGKDKVKMYCYSQQTSKPNLIKDPNCNNARCNAKELEDLIVEDLLRHTDDIVTDGSGSEKLREKRITGIVTLQQKCDILSAKIKRLYNLYAESGNELLRETITENQNELLSLEKMLEHEQASVNAVSEISNTGSAVKNLRGKWYALTMREKQRFARICIGRITVTDDAVDIHYLV